MAESLDIAEVARLTGLTSRALRFYEARGLVAPLRSARHTARAPRTISIAATQISNPAAARTDSTVRVATSTVPSSTSEIVWPIPHTAPRIAPRHALFASTTSVVTAAM